MELRAMKLVWETEASVPENRDVLLYCPHEIEPYQVGKKTAWGYETQGGICVKPTLWADLPSDGCVYSVSRRQL